MPIRVAAGVVVNPTPPPTPTPREKLAAAWAAPDGNVWPMTNRALGYWVLKGAIAFGAAPIAITADADERGGETPRNIQYQRRLITWPMNLQGKTHTEFIKLWRKLGDAFAQTTVYNKPGWLTVTRPDGSSRMIAAYYQDGWEETQPEAGWMRDQPVVTLYCPQPWWLATTETVIERVYTGGSSHSFFTGFPHISSSQTLGDTTVTNNGDVEAWPVWTLTGPATGLTATRHNADGTDDTFALTATLDAGEIVTIATDDPEILGPDGSSWIDKLNWPTEADLWSIPRGTTSVTFTVSGSDTGTSIRLAFSERYSTG